MSSTQKKNLLSLLMVFCLAFLLSGCWLENRIRKYINSIYPPVTSYDQSQKSVVANEENLNRLERFDLQLHIEGEDFTSVAEKMIHERIEEKKTSIGVLENFSIDLHEILLTEQAVFASLHFEGDSANPDFSIKGELSGVVAVYYQNLKIFIGLLQ